MPTIQPSVFSSQHLSHTCSPHSSVCSPNLGSSGLKFGRKPDTDQATFTPSSAAHSSSSTLSQMRLAPPSLGDKLKNAARFSWEYVKQGFVQNLIWAVVFGGVSTVLAFGSGIFTGPIVLGTGVLYHALLGAYHGFKHA